MQRSTVPPTALFRPVVLAAAVALLAAGGCTRASRGSETAARALYEQATDLLIHTHIGPEAG
jgi:hypothetical protein